MSSSDHHDDTGGFVEREVMHEDCLHCDRPYLEMFRTPHGLRCNRCINEPMGGGGKISNDAAPGQKAD